MRFSTIATGLLSVVGLAAAAPTVEKRAFTADQLVTNINKLTQDSQNLQRVASAIPTGNSVIAKRQFSLPTPFNPLIEGLQQLVQTTTSNITTQQGTQPYTDADAQKVCTAFSRMATTQTNLFNTISTKSGLLQGIFLGPVAAVLRSCENVIDTFAFGVYDVVPVCMEAISAKKSTLDDALGKAVCAYTPSGSLGLNLFC